MVDGTGNAMKGYCLSLSQSLPLSLSLPFSLYDQFHNISDFLVLAMHSV